MIKFYEDIEIIKRIENKLFIAIKWESFYLEKK